MGRRDARAWRAIVLAVWVMSGWAMGGRAALAADADRPLGALYVSPNGSDSGNGSRDAPLRTIFAASQRAQPGTVVHVAPGIYEGGFTTKASGADRAPIAYLSDVKWGSKIVPPQKAGPDIGWENKGSHVTIDGFELDGLRRKDGRGDTPWRIGIYSIGSYSVIRNTHVHNIGLTTACTNMGGAGLEGDSYYRGTDIDLLRNVVHDIGSGGCKFIHGLYQTATGRVAKNLVYRVSGWGIHLWHDAHDITVADNIAFGNTEGGILVGGGDYVHTTGPADRVTVADNIVFDNTKVGIVETGDTGIHNRYVCNMSYNNGTNWRLRTSSAEPCDASSISYDSK